MYTLKDFRIAETIYESPTSIVFRGNRISDDRPVIIKMLKGTHPSPRELSRYHHEYNLLRSLDIDTVIDVLGLQTYENTLFLIVEDFGAESLKNLLTLSPFPLEQILEIAISVALTLSRLHEQHIIHKDVNPSNIVYNPKTRVCKLIDFGIATLVSPNSPNEGQRNALEGTLAYISPEQTGRMNRTIDHRSDLYSLGVSLYELMTGRLPFQQRQAVEMVHAHIAGTVPKAHEANPQLPEVLSDIVSRLMAKTVEQRYQSAVGLASDLETCLRQLRETGTMVPFALGRNEHNDVFYLPQKLYGREDEIATLLSVFNDRVLGQGETACLLISGYSGSGKTALAKEILKPINGSNGYFVEGKFDQYQRVIPYYAFKQALAGLIDRWLAESEERLAEIAAGLHDALGYVGQVMVQIIPSLELVIGPQPSVPDLSGAEAQNRFNYVARNFFRYVASAQHPLAIFIDDLQWADLASLNLISVLLSDARITHLFLIGAYRDNETSPSHPLMLMVASLVKKAIAIESMQVGNLREEDLVSLCGDALQRNDEDVRTLARLIWTKTLGNPFFVCQFLRALYTDRLITYDVTREGWRFDIEDIERRNIPDDVVQLMTAKIRNLSHTSQRLLTFAACIGNAVDLHVLSLIYEKDVHETREDLNEAVREGLIIPYDDATVRFSHDRIQQASYSLMENSERVHLLIGRSLLANTGEDAAGEGIFAIANQLDAARRLIEDPEERLVLIRINRAAAERAKRAAAYPSALRYLTIAAELLPEEAWNRHYDLAFAIHTELAWCLFYAGETESIEDLFNRLLSEAKNLQDRMKVHMIRMEYHHLQGRYAQAVNIQTEALRLLGIEVEAEERGTLVSNEIETVSGLLGGRTIEELADAPQMESPHYNMVMDVLRSLWTSAYLDAQVELVAWSSCKMTSISLQYGNNHLTSYGYMNYAYVCVALLDQYETGHRFGRVAIRLAEKFNDPLIRGKVYLLFAVFVNHWRAPLLTSAEYSLKSFPLLVENGDWTYAGYCAEFAISDPTICGVPCDQLYEEAMRYIPFLQDNAPVVLEEFFRPACLNPLLQLLGRTRSDSTFDDDHFSEERFLNDYQNNALALSYFYTVKLRSLYLFGHLKEALEMFDKADFVARVALAQAKVPEVYFFASLTVLASFASLSPEQRAHYDTAIARYQERMKLWAANSPENFLHKYLLVEAERAHCAARDWEALELYDAAAEEARKSGYLYNEGLAKERTADFLLKRGLLRLAAHFMNEARYTYQRWGATAKVAQIDGQYGNLLSLSRLDTASRGASLIHTTTETSHEVSSTTDSLDLFSIVEASQSIAGEIRLESLLTKMMQIVMANAGADRAVLLTMQDGSWSIRAEARSIWNEVSTTQDVLAESEQNASLPLSVLNYCTRKRKSLVLDDASGSGIFVRDLYFASKSIKSVLCIPLLRSGTLKGALYLENSLVAGAFSPEQLKVIEILSSQIVMSIENAEFYRGLEQLVEQRTMELAKVNADLVEANGRLERLSRIDGLTQIANRRAFDQFVGREWRRHQRMQYDFSLVICDIDHFKRFNDKYGHLVGDECLRLVAEALIRVMRRPGDLVARYGGEEFVIVLSETGLEGVMTVVQMAQENVHMLRVPTGHPDVSTHVTLSFGVLHTIPRQGQEVKDALRAADRALYEAKSQGRNCFVITEEVSLID
jgi:diguanylate cyclase (GGDEF)-like protein